MNVSNVETFAYCVKHCTWLIINYYVLVHIAYDVSWPFSIYLHMCCPCLWFSSESPSYVANYLCQHHFVMMKLCHLEIVSLSLVMQASVSCIVWHDQSCIYYGVAIGYMFSLMIHLNPVWDISLWFGPYLDPIWTLGLSSWVPPNCLSCFEAQGATFCCGCTAAGNGLWICWDREVHP